MREKKEFTLEFHSDERTHWLVNDDELAELVRTLNYSLAAVNTTGATPMINVSLVKPEVELELETPLPASFYFCRACLRYTKGRKDHVGVIICKHCHSTRLRLQADRVLVQPSTAIAVKLQRSHAS